MPQLQQAGGTDSDGSPRPPGLLYKPELRSVAERVKYIEKRNGSGQLSPRLPSPRSVGSDSGQLGQRGAGSRLSAEGVPATTVVQHQV